MQPAWRGEVPSLELLNRMAAAEPPLGLRSGPLEPFFQRDIYYDSADWALRRRGVSCRFRIRVDDRRILTLRAVPRLDPGGGALALTFEADVPELEGAQALAGTSDPARRVRALVDPALLMPRVQFETERRVRRTVPRWLARGRYEILYDVVTVRHQQRAQAFQEVRIRQLAAGRPGFVAVVQAFRELYGLRTLLVEKVDRAAKLLQELESGALASGARTMREVALIAIDGDKVAMLADSSTLTLPIRGGSGEATCREILHAFFGSADGQIRFLGTAPGGATRPLLEVWLARGVATERSGDGAAARRLSWLPVDEVLGSVGSPLLRDPRTLAALTVVGRSEMVVERRSQRHDVPHERRARLSDYAMRAPVLDEDIDQKQQLLNSDLGLVEFNTRVLGLAEDPRVPLLARIRFLSILSSNLDEFFMVRVAALKRAKMTGSDSVGDDGLTIEEVLHAIGIRARTLLERQARCWKEVCEPELATHGVRILRWTDLTAGQQTAVRRYFMDEILPLITPQAMTRAPGHPFPLLPHLRLSLAVMIGDSAAGPIHSAYLKVPDTIPRFVPSGDGNAFIPVEEVIRANLELLYPGRVTLGAFAFRVTRGADMELDEQGATSLATAIEEGTKRRPYGAAVRVEAGSDMPQELRDLLLRELQFEEAASESPPGSSDVYVTDGLVDLGALRELARLPLPDLDYPPHRGAAPLEANRSVFDILSERDVLVHHPYDDFEATVQRFMVEAADDPDVVAIKLTLYRVGGRSAMVEALQRAARRGAEVFVFVELKARFDEERNLEWARKLEQAGVRVVHGLVELKTHAKTALVVRREAAGIKRYVHIGTGNYNAATAAVYTDVGLLSADAALGADLNDLFNELSGSSRPPQTAFRRILVSPTYLAARLLELIEGEAARAREGGGGAARIRAKLNGLTDTEVIAALYGAAQAGVPIDLIVRGPCMLRPGVAGLSERIRVVSVLGRFLEHSRIYHFASHPDAQYYIGSADWRPRNLRHRVEVVTPVVDGECCRRLDTILETGLTDPTAWELQPDGSYRRGPR